MFGHDFYDQLQLGKQSIPVIGYMVTNNFEDDATIEQEYDILYIDNEGRGQVVLARDIKERPVILYYNGYEERFKVCVYLTPVDHFDYARDIDDAIDWLEEELDVGDLKAWKRELSKIMEK